MIEELKGLLSKTVPPRGFLPAMQPENFSDEAFQARTEAAREALRQAFLERDAAAAEVAEAEATIERIEGLIAEVDTAQQVLKEAEEASATFTKKWAEAGARPDKPRTDAGLVAKAAQAAREAEAARIAADGAQAGLSAAHGRLWDSQNRHDAAQSKVKEAVAAVLVAMLEPQFITVQQAAATLEEASAEIQSCARALSGGWYEFSSNSAASGLLNRLRAAMPAAPAADTSALIHQRSQELAARSAEFVRLATKLLTDADAE